jgi:hypothetical protein
MKTKENFKLRALLLVVISCFFSVNGIAQGVANFSGSWAYNESKSVLGEGGFRMISQTVTITQNDQSFTLERTFKGQDGEDRKMTEAYTLDGKESVNPVFNTSKKSKAVWSADNKVLTVSSVMVFEMNGEQNEIKTVEVYKLGDAGKSLTIESKSSSSMGERIYTLAYDKK